MRYGPICSWVAGWFNLLGGAASTAGVAFTTAQLIANFILVATGTATGGGYLATQVHAWQRTRGQFDGCHCTSAHRMPTSSENPPHAPSTRCRACCWPSTA
jgi:hypothetical protein